MFEQTQLRNNGNPYSTALIKLLKFLDTINNVGLVDVEHLSSNNVVVQNLIHLVKIENDIHFAHALEIGIHRLYKEMNRLQSQKLIILRIHGCSLGFPF